MNCPPFIAVTVVVGALLALPVAAAEDDEFRVEGFDEAPAGPSEGGGEFQVEGFEAQAPAGFEEGFQEPPGFAEGEFPDIEIKTDTEALELEEERGFTFGGKLRARMDVSPRKPDPDFGFNRKRAGISELSSTLDLELDTSLGERIQARLGLTAELTERYNSHRDPELYPNSIRDKDVRRMEPGETYLDWRPLNNLWLRLGNQINIWGTSDNYRVVDLLNPRDQRLFEQEGPEETRLPNWASRLSYSTGPWSADLVGIYHFRGDRVGKAGADYDPYILFRTPQTTVLRDKGPGNYKPELAMRLNRSFHAADASLYVGKVYNKVAVTQFRNFDVASGQIQFKPNYDRIGFVGVSGSYVRGSWLFKTDMAYKHDLSFLRQDFFAIFNPVAPPANLLEKDTLEGMWGVEYNGLSNSSVSLEVVGRRILDYESVLLDERNTFGGVATFMNDALLDTLHSEVRVIKLFNGAGYIFNAKVEYDFTDDLDVTVTYTDYLSTDKDGFMQPYRRNDRLLLGVTYRF